MKFEELTEIILAYAKQYACSINQSIDDIEFDGPDGGSGLSNEDRDRLITYFENNAEPRFYKNPAYVKRHHECMNLVACQAPANRLIGKWEECTADVLDGLTHLFTENDVKYYGYL